MAAATALATPGHLCGKRNSMPQTLACCQHFGDPEAACGAAAPPPAPCIAGWGTAPAWAQAGSCCSPLADPGHRRRCCCRPCRLHPMLLQLLLLLMRMNPAWLLPAAACGASCTHACGPPSRPAAGTAASCMQHKAGGRPQGFIASSKHWSAHCPPSAALSVGSNVGFCQKRIQRTTHQ